MRRILIPLLWLAGAAPALDLQTAKVVDLSHPFDKQTVYWPTSPTQFTLKSLHDGKTPGGWYYRANTLCTPEHGGTHLDAPAHFSKEGQAADQVPLEKLIGPAAIFDVREKAEGNADYRLALEDITAWEKKNGPVPEGAIAILRTGWESRWADRKRYLGSDKKGDASKLHFPSFGEDAAAFLIQSRKVKAIGVDTASIDYGPSKDFEVHQIAGKANVPGLENLMNLTGLPEKGAWIVALPMKIAGGSGGPLRAIALLP